VIGCAAFLTSWKGQDVFLDAIARMRHGQEVKVELMGGHGPKDGPFVRVLRERVAQPDLDGRVEILGDVSDPLARMRTWTVAVSASVDPEAGPLATLEAMSIGLPMVGPDHGGTAEVLTGAGLLVPPGDPDAMAAALDRLLEDTRLWDALHAEGPRKIAAELTLDSQIDQLLDVVATVAHESDATRSAWRR
jgi:glycosyltransferase involved in cell wall biosynthesis